MFSRLLLLSAALALSQGAALAFEVSSPSLAALGWSRKYIADSIAGCDGDNVSVALVWRDPPPGTKSYMLTMYDPNAPKGGKGFLHWLAWDIPANATGLAEGAASTGGAGLPPGTVLGKDDVGRVGYLGPCPPPGSGVHHYILTLTALKVASLGAVAGASADEVAADAAPDAIATATATYPYRR